MSLAEGGNDVQEPIRFVHTDYTITSAPERLMLLGKPPKANDTLQGVLGDMPLIPADVVKRAIEEGERYMIVNVWRNISTEPIESYPLGVCAGSTYDADDLVVLEVHYEDRIGENYFVKHNDKHQWYYYPRMTPDEALVMMQWDSRASVGTHDPTPFSFHCAFKDPTTRPGAPDRESIECRVVAVF